MRGRGLTKPQAVLRIGEGRPDMKLGHFEIFVRDPKASLAFYRDVLGFKLVQEQGDRYVWIRSGSKEVLLRPASEERLSGAPAYGQARIALVLYTHDLEAAKQDLARQGVTIRDVDGSPDCPVFTDPDGNWIQLVNPHDQQ